MDRPTEYVRLRLLVSGRVQGVGYRRFVERRAALHGLAGWVRNRMDGSVEIAVEGPRHVVDELHRAVRAGPPGARVIDVDVSSLDEAEPLPRPFDIRRG
jgi:acylphosphatase